MMQQFDLSMVNLVNSEITRKNFSDGKAELGEAIEQIMANQYYLTTLLLKLNGADVEYLGEQLEQKIKFDEKEDRWMWNSK